MTLSGCRCAFQLIPGAFQVFFSVFVGFSASFDREGCFSLQDGPRVPSSVPRLPGGHSECGCTSRPIGCCGSRGSEPLHIGGCRQGGHSKQGATRQVPGGRTSPYVAAGRSALAHVSVLSVVADAVHVGRRTGSTCSSATPARTCRSSARRRQGPRVGHCFLEANFGANFCLKTRLAKPYKKHCLRSTIQKTLSKKTIQKRASQKPYTKHCLSRSGPGRRSHRVQAIAF